MRKVLDVIWGVWKRKYFCKGDSTQNCPTGKSPRRREPLSCPGRAAALFALLRRAGTHIDAARWTPAQQRTAARCAADPGNAVAPPEVYQTCLMKECGESKFRSCPGRGAAPFALLRRAGTHIDAARWTPAQQRTAARCAASGERCGPAGGLSDVSDEGMRREQIPLVSRTRCSALRAAPQSGHPHRHWRRWAPDQQRTTPRRAARCAASGERDMARRDSVAIAVARMSAATCGATENEKTPDVASLIRATLARMFHESMLPI